MDVVRAHEGQLEAARQEDAPPTFEEFYALHREPVGRALAMTLGNAHLATEAVDEAMARAFQRWAQVSSMSNPTGWTYRVGLNWARSFMRRRRRRLPPPNISETNSEESVADPTVHHALAALPDGQRAAVVCRLLLGLSESQTAETLGIKPGTVKSRLARGIHTLSSSLVHLDPRLERTEHY